MFVEINSLLEQATEFTQKASDSFDASLKDLQGTYDAVVGTGTPGLYVLAPTQQQRTRSSGGAEDVAGTTISPKSSKTSKKKDSSQRSSQRSHHHQHHLGSSSGGGLTCGVWEDFGLQGDAAAAASGWRGSNKDNNVGTGTDAVRATETGSVMSDLSSVLGPRLSSSSATLPSGRPVPPGKASTTTKPSPSRPFDESPSIISNPSYDRTNASEDGTRTGRSTLIEENDSIVRKLFDGSNHSSNHSNSIHIRPSPSSSSSSPGSRSCRIVKRTLSRSKTHKQQEVGLDVSVLITKQWGPLLVISDIAPNSLFAGTDLTVGDAILSVNGVSVNEADKKVGGVRVRGRPSIERARSLLKNPKVKQVTVGYQILDGRRSSVRGENVDDKSPNSTATAPSVGTSPHAASDAVQWIAHDADDEGEEKKCDDDGNNCTAVQVKSGLNRRISTNTKEAGAPTRPDPVREQKNPPEQPLGLWARALRRDRNKQRTDRGTPDQSPNKRSTNRTTNVGSAVTKKSRLAPQRGRSPLLAFAFNHVESSNTNRGRREEKTPSPNAAKTPSPTKVQSKKQDPFSISSHSRRSQATAEGDPSTPNFRLAELRARNHRLRTSAHERIVESKRRLDSSKDETIRPPGGPAIERVEIANIENASCDSPKDFATQLRHDVKRTSEAVQKERYQEKVDVLKRQLLSTAYKTLDGFAGPETESTISPTSPDENEEQDDNHGMSLHQKENPPTYLPDLSAGVNSVGLSCWQASPGETCQDMSIVDESETPPTLEIRIAKESPPTNAINPRNIKEQRKVALLDESSVSRMEHTEAREWDTSAIVTDRGTATCEDVHEETNQVNRKVTEKLRSKAEQLQRTNMLLTEEIQSLRSDDTRKASVLTTLKNRLIELYAREQSLKAELELSRSQFSICTIQADKRQHEFFSEIDNLKLSNDLKVESLNERIGSLERTNRRLLGKLQEAEKEWDKMQEIQSEMEQLTMKMAYQSAALDTASAANEELQTRNEVLKEEIEKYRGEKEENAEHNQAIEIAVCTARTSFLEQKVETLKHELRAALSAANESRQQARLFKAEAEGAWKLCDELEEKLNGATKLEIDARSPEILNHQQMENSCEGSCDSSSCSVLVERIRELENALMGEDLPLDERVSLGERLHQVVSRLTARDNTVDGGDEHHTF